MRPMTNRESATALFVIALYYWYREDKLNSRNALEVAVNFAKEHENVTAKEETRNRGREVGAIHSINFPTKRAASTA